MSLSRLRLGGLIEGQAKLNEVKKVTPSWKKALAILHANVNISSSNNNNGNGDNNDGQDSNNNSINKKRESLRGARPMMVLTGSMVNETVVMLAAKRSSNMNPAQEKKMKQQQQFDKDDIKKGKISIQQSKELLSGAKKSFSSLLSIVQESEELVTSDRESTNDPEFIAVREEAINEATQQTFFAARSVLPNAASMAIRCLLQAKGSASELSLSASSSAAWLDALELYRSNILQGQISSSSSSSSSPFSKISDLISEFAITQSAPVAMSYLLNGMIKQVGTVNSLATVSRLNAQYKRSVEMQNTELKKIAGNIERILTSTWSNVVAKNAKNINNSLHNNKHNNMNMNMSNVKAEDNFIALLNKTLLAIKQYDDSVKNTARGGSSVFIEGAAGTSLITLLLRDHIELSRFVVRFIKANAASSSTNNNNNISLFTSIESGQEKLKSFLLEEDANDETIGGEEEEGSENSNASSKNDASTLLTQMESDQKDDATRRACADILSANGFRVDVSLLSEKTWKRVSERVVNEVNEEIMMSVTKNDGEKMRLRMIEEKVVQFFDKSIATRTSLELIRKYFNIDIPVSKLMQMTTTSSSTTKIVTRKLLQQSSPRQLEVIDAIQQAWVDDTRKPLLRELSIQRLVDEDLFEHAALALRGKYLKLNFYEDSRYLNSLETDLNTFLSGLYQHVVAIGTMRELAAIKKEDDALLGNRDDGESSELSMKFGSIFFPITMSDAHQFRLIVTDDENRNTTTSVNNNNTSGGTASKNSEEDENAVFGRDDENPLTYVALNQDEQQQQQQTDPAALSPSAAKIVPRWFFRKRTIFKFMRSFAKHNALWTSLLDHCQLDPHGVSKQYIDVIRIRSDARLPPRPSFLSDSDSKNNKNNIIDKGADSKWNFQAGRTLAILEIKLDKYIDEHLIPNQKSNNNDNTSDDGDEKEKNNSSLSTLFRAKFLPQNTDTPTKSLPIVYRDKDVAVIGKPHNFSSTGIIVNAASSSSSSSSSQTEDRLCASSHCFGSKLWKTSSILDALFFSRTTSTSTMTNTIPSRLGITSRLDKGTSGYVVFSFSDEAMHRVRAGQKMISEVGVGYATSVTKMCEERSDEARIVSANVGADGLTASEESGITNKDNDTVISSSLDDQQQQASSYITPLVASRSGRLWKHYYALVIRTVELPSKSGIISAPIRGQPALTRYKILKEYIDHGIALVRCSICTGRRHQIREHMSSIGCPIVNDVLVGGPLAATNLFSSDSNHHHDHQSHKDDDDAKEENIIDDDDTDDEQETSSSNKRHQKGNHLALHLYESSFVRPEDGERVCVTMPIPEEFANALSKLEQDEQEKQRV